MFSFIWTLVASPAMPIVSVVRQASVIHSDTSIIYSVPQATFIGRLVLLHACPIDIVRQESSVEEVETGNSEPDRRDWVEQTLPQVAVNPVSSSGLQMTGSVGDKLRYFQRANAIPKKKNTLVNVVCRC